MPYRVILTPEAEADLRTAYRYLRKHAPRAAREWIRRARQSIKSLSHHPERCPLAPESSSFDEPIRELLFGTGNRGTYRFLFAVFGKSVYILHVRHGSMLPLDPNESE
jgi:plasmid stabilization system protein ParE